MITTSDYSQSQHWGRHQLSTPPFHFPTPYPPTSSNSSSINLVPRAFPLNGWGGEKPWGRGWSSMDSASGDHIRWHTLNTLNAVFFNTVWYYIGARNFCGFLFMRFFQPSAKIISGKKIKLPQTFFPQKSTPSRWLKFAIQKYSTDQRNRVCSARL